MIIVMQKGASKREIESVEREIERFGYQTHPIYGVERTVIGCVTLLASVAVLRPWIG